MDWPRRGSMDMATTRMPWRCAGEQRRSTAADLRSVSMASLDIEPQVMKIGSRLDEAPRRLPSTARDVHAGACGAVTTGCGTGKPLA
jgi:hypothetical protein